MSRLTAVERPPEPDFSAMTTEELIAYREAENGRRASGAARAILGETDPGSAIEWRDVALPGRDLPVRVYRPVPAGDGETAARTDLPLAVFAEYADSPTPALPRLRLLRRLAVPPGTDARAFSPLYADDLSGLAPALLVVPSRVARAEIFEFLRSALQV